MLQLHEEAISVAGAETSVDGILLVDHPPRILQEALQKVSAHNLDSFIPVVVFVVEGRRSYKPLEYLFCRLL